MKNLYDFICDVAFRSEHHTSIGNNLSDAITILLSLLFSFALYSILKIIVAKITKIRRSRKRISFVTTVFSRKTINLLVNIFAAWVFFSLLVIIMRSDRTISTIEILFSKFTLLYIYILLLVFATFVISAINEFYEKKFDFSSQYPIYSYLKVVVVFVWLFGLTLIICYFTNTSPWAFLTGLGAVSAVLLLIFRDTLLGIVASIQVTASNIVRIGDRITIDSYGIDGKVLDIAISTVKIKNADNTIANIPTYSLSSQVVKNWRAMEESGARRIKRSINIDIESIKSLEEDVINSLKNLPMLRDFMSKNIEVLNNLSLYRIYLTEYLENCKYINKDFTIMVHHLDVNTSGLPLEVSAYTSDVTTLGHENVKAELFEHFYEMLNLFELKIKQI